MNNGLKIENKKEMRIQTKYPKISEYFALSPTPISISYVFLYYERMLIS